MTDSCIFCKINRGEVPAQKVYEDEKVMVFKDIKPKAAVHLLVVPREHIPSLIDVKKKDAPLLSHMMLLLPDLAAEQGLAGFRTVINNGAQGGQEVPHLHIHLLGGPVLPKF